MALTEYSSSSAPELHLRLDGLQAGIDRTVAIAVGTNSASPAANVDLGVRPLAAFAECWLRRQQPVVLVLGSSRLVA